MSRRKILIGMHPMTTSQSVTMTTSHSVAMTTSHSVTMTTSHSVTMTTSHSVTSHNCIEPEAEAEKKHNLTPIISSLCGRYKLRKTADVDQGELQWSDAKIGRPYQTARHLVGLK